MPGTVCRVPDAVCRVVANMSGALEGSLMALGAEKSDENTTSPKQDNPKKISNVVTVAAEEALGEFAWCL